MSKEITGFRPGSRKWKEVMAFVYGWGGALVIIGAMFKIQHWPGAGPVLIGGLSVEAVIFILSAFEPLHEDPDWTLVYPELSALDEVSLEEIVEDDGTAGELEDSKIDNNLTVTEQLDNMLEEAKIGPELIDSLGQGLKGLSDQTAKLNDMTDASVATNEYVDNIKTASQSVSTLSDSYAKASESLGVMTVSNEEGQNFGEQMGNISKNLSSLNEVYELQLKNSSEQLETSNKFYSGIAELLGHLNDSVEDTKKYKENINELSSNLSSLNTVYGNMLSAMNVNKG